MATRKKNLSKAQTLNRTLADIYAPSDPDPSLFDIRNNVFENVRLSQEANAKSNFSKHLTWSDALGPLGPSGPTSSSFDMRNNIYKNIHLSQEANAKSNFSKYESDTQKILSRTPLNSLSDSKLYKTNLSKLSNQIATHNFNSSIPGVKSIPISPEQVKIDRQNYEAAKQKQINERAKKGAETLGKIQEKYGYLGEDTDVVTSGYEDLGNANYNKKITKRSQERYDSIHGDAPSGDKWQTARDAFEDEQINQQVADVRTTQEQLRAEKQSKLSNQITKDNFEKNNFQSIESSIPGIKSIPTSPEQVKIDRQNYEKRINILRQNKSSQERYDSIHGDTPSGNKWQAARDAFENEQLDLYLNNTPLNKIKKEAADLNASLDKKQQEEEVNRQKKLDEINDKKYGYQDISAEEKLGIRNQFQERFEDPTGMKRLTRNVMASSNSDGGVLDKAYSSGNSSEEFGKILHNNKKAFQKGVKDKSIRGYNSDHFSQYLDDNIGKIAEGSSAEAKKAFLDYAQTVKTARTNAEEQIENTKIKLDELKENGRKVNGKTDYLKMRQSFNAEELSELTKVSGAKRARFMDTLSKGINKLSFGHLHLNNNRVLNIQNEQIKNAYDKKLKGTEERLKNQQTLLQKINDYDDTAISSSQTAKGAHKAAGRYGLTGEQGERHAAENVAKKLKNLGWKGKAGAVVGLLALGGIIGNQFAGGHQTNAQLYNPSPQPQYYS